MINGQWLMVNGQWSMVNGQWSMVNGQWSMVKNDMNEIYHQFWQKGRTSYFVSRWGEVVSTTNPDDPEPLFRTIATYNGKGYRRVRLQGKTFKVHRLVAEAFVPNPDHLPYVLHKDGDRENNHFMNLEWSEKQSNHVGKGIVNSEK